MLWLLNKVDQIKNMERKATMRKVLERAAEFGDRVTVQYFSGLKRQGVDELARTLEGWLLPAESSAPANATDSLTTQTATPTAVPEKGTTESEPLP